MLLPRPVDRHLADRRADADDAHAVGGELGLDLVAQAGVEVHDVLAVHAAELEVRDAIGVTDADLLVQVRPDLVGEGGEVEHRAMVWPGGTAVKARWPPVGYDAGMAVGMPVVVLLSLVSILLPFVALGLVY